MNSGQWQNVLESLTLFISASAVLVQNLRNAIEANMQQGGEGGESVGGAGAAGAALTEMPPCAAFIEEESEEENGLCYCPLKKKQKDSACPCPSNEQHKKGALPASRSGNVRRGSQTSQGEGQQSSPGASRRESKSKVGKSVSYIDEQRVKQQQDGGVVAPEEERTPRPSAQIGEESADGGQILEISIVEEGEIIVQEEESVQVNTGDQETPSAEGAAAEKEEPNVQKSIDPDGDGEDSNDEAQRPAQPPKGRICPLSKKGKKPKSKIITTASQPNLEEISALRSNLQSAQKSLSDVEERLRRMERNMQDFDSKNTPSGQPNPAALYREIMKPQSVPFLGTPLAHSSAIGLQQDVCPPSCQARPGQPHSGSSSGGGGGVNLGQSKTLGTPPFFHELGSGCPGSPGMGCGQMPNVTFGTPAGQGIRGVVSPYRPTPSLSSQWNGTSSMDAGQMQNPGYATQTDQRIRGVVSPYRPTPSLSSQWNGSSSMDAGQMQNPGYATPTDQRIRGVVSPYRPTPPPSPQDNVGPRGGGCCTGGSSTCNDNFYGNVPAQFRQCCQPENASVCKLFLDNLTNSEKEYLSQMVSQDVSISVKGGNEHDVSSSGNCRSGCPPGSCAMPPSRPGDPGRTPKKINYLRTAPFPGCQMRPN